jgi:hypothetical protein
MSMFTEAERRIFSYKSQGRDLKGDPIALLNRFIRFLGGDEKMAETMEAAHSGPPEEGCAALVQLQKATCFAFDLGQPWDPLTGQGVQEDEWFPVYCDFFEWLKKNETISATTQTSSEPSASPAPGKSPTKTTAA